MNRESCVDKREGQRAARGMLEKIVECGWLGRTRQSRGATFSPRLVKEVLKALGKQLVDDGRLDSVRLYAAGQTAHFPQLDAQEWQDDEYDQQGHLLDPIKVKEGRKRGYRLGVEAKAH